MGPHLALDALLPALDVLDDALPVAELLVALPEHGRVLAHLLLVLPLHFTGHLLQLVPPVLLPQAVQVSLQAMQDSSQTG